MSAGDRGDRGDPRAASWWSATLRARPLLRLLNGWSAPIVWAGAGLTFGGCAEIFSETASDPAPGALEDQQQSGWNVGDQERLLAFPGGQGADVSGGTGWQNAMTTLALRLTPAELRWSPYYVPTLFQSLEAPRSADLRAAIRPIFTPEMAVASRRGEALLSLFLEGGGCRSDVGVVLDLSGPESVAVAAALAPCFDPVFVIGNWPHPDGVVPAHLTLGAALYYLPSFEGQRLSRAVTAAPVFVLDRQRLAPYTDDAGQFDNRYFAGLPSREVLQAAGIKHLLYVTPDDQVTLDSEDLNGDLVALDEGGLDVKMLALSDFSQVPLPGWPADPTPACAPGSGSLGPIPRFFFGGSPSSHGCFPWWYGWSSPSPPHPLLAGGTHWAPIPSRLAPRCQFHPMLRATFPMAAGAPRPLGGPRPTPGGTGSVAFGRSGSLGRMHGGFSG
jgi:hypothetical protein